MSDNAPAKFVTMWPWHFNEPALYIMKDNANNNKLFVLLKPLSSFRFQYRLLTMATFFEIAVYYHNEP